MDPRTSTAVIIHHSYFSYNVDRAGLYHYARVSGNKDNNSTYMLVKTRRCIPTKTPFGIQ